MAVRERNPPELVWLSLTLRQTASRSAISGMQAATCQAY